MNDLSRPADVEHAAREVERRQVELSQSIQAAGESGQRMARRLGAQLKPALIGVAVAAGAAAVIGLVLLARRRRPGGWQVPQPRSAVASVARQAGLGLLRWLALQAARTVAQRVATAALAEAPPARAQ
jgi:hypothetical protein